MGGSVPQVLNTSYHGGLAGFYILAGYDVRLAVMCVIGVPFDVIASVVYSKFFEKYNERVRRWFPRDGAKLAELSLVLERRQARTSKRANKFHSFLVANQPLSAIGSF